MHVYFIYNGHQNYKNESNKIRHEYNHKISNVYYIILCGNKCNRFYEIKYKPIE